jgi:hypothetical protein
VSLRSRGRHLLLACELVGITITADGVNLAPFIMPSQSGSADKSNALIAIIEKGQ